MTHLEAAIDGTVLPAGTLQTTHEGRPLWVRYDLDALASDVDRDALRERPPGMWRYAELLPLADQQHRVYLGETMSPLLEAPRLGAHLGLERLLIKDESRLPTGSFKARGMAMAVSMAGELGVERVAAPTAGNAGGAMAAYAARAGMEAWVFMPADMPMAHRLLVHHGQVDGHHPVDAPLVSVGPPPSPLAVSTASRSTAGSGGQGRAEPR